MAVNRKKDKNGKQETDYFKVTAWRQLGDICQKWLIKGRKVAVVGPVSVSTYEGRDGKTHASLEITADDVEFLSSKEKEPVDQESGMTVVQDELPWDN